MTPTLRQLGVKLVNSSHFRKAGYRPILVDFTHHIFRIQFFGYLRDFLNEFDHVVWIMVAIGGLERSC